MKKASCIALIVASAATMLSVPSAGRAAPAGGPSGEPSRSAFLEKCSRCHEPARAYGVIGDWPEWVLTAARMAIKDRDWIPPDTLKLIIEYGSRYDGHQKALFRDRCGECHGWEELGKLGKSATQWRTWTRFMAGRHGVRISLEECELLVTGLVRRHRDVDEGRPSQGAGADGGAPGLIGSGTAVSGIESIR